jgi:F0F1-type ATP synthase membrane subunit b/b'
MNTKEAYQEKVEAQMAELKARIDLLEAKASQVKADAKVEYNEQLDELHQQQKEAEGRLEALQAASQEVWRDLRADVDEAMTTLQDTVTSTSAKFE